ncbi:MAG: tetratricopeptide repeat protein [Acidobacteria bacterium]|nr:MAG: tetratricopeptide repeat protein [Acidobacteriota bacterium]
MSIRTSNHRITVGPTPCAEPWSYRSALVGRLPLAALALSTALACGAPGRSPNLLVITLDTTRADRLGAYGYQAGTTPHLDALAERGAVLERHLTPVPITLPSHTTLFTGRYPPTHTVRDNGVFTVPESELMLAEVLRDRGYATYGFPAAFPLDGRFGIDQGFDLYDDDFLDQDRGERDMPGLYFDERPAAEVVRAAISGLEARDPGRPFFAFLHFFDPHQPMQPAPPFDLRFRADPYDAEIAAVDHQIGKLFEYLRAAELLDDTIVLVTADHGEALGEHGELTHSILLHQATLHIPAILAGPGVPEGLRSEEWTSSTQLFATLIELLGLTAPDVPLAGESLVPLLRNEGRRPASMAAFESYFETLAPRTTQGWAQLAAFMRGGWRLVHGPSERLYDLESDPRELADRRAEQQDVAAALRGELRDFLNEHETSSAGAAQQEIDAETQRRLAALGYLQSGESVAVGDFLDFEGRSDPHDLVIDVALFSQAKAATIAGQRLAAKALWEKVIERSPGNPTAYQGMAQLYSGAGDVGTAIAWAQRGLQRIPESEQLLEMAGVLLIEAKRYQEGIDHLRALPDPEEGVRTITWIAWALRELGEVEQAEEWLRRGLEVAPEDRWLRLYLANLLSRQQRFDEAEELYTEVLQSSPFFALAHFNYGLMLRDTGRTESALRRVARAAALAPSHEPSRRLLSELRRATAGAGP